MTREDSVILRFLSMTLALGVSAIILILANVASVSAQTPQQIVITRIDTNQFPLISVQFSATDTTGAAFQNLLAENLIIREDGTPVEITDFQIDNTGVAIALLLDASGNILTLPGGSGKVRIEEARNAILDLADSNLWLDKDGRSDFVTLLVPDTNGSFTKLVPASAEVATNDYNELHNGIYRFTPAPIANTPLFRMLFEAIKTLQADPRTTLQRKMVIVFSDGINVFDDIQFADAAAQANAAHIPVHTVLLAAKNAATPQGNPDSLRRLALLTGGQPVWYNSPDAMKPIYSQIGGLREQYVATYRSKLNISGKHEVAVSIQGDSSQLSPPGKADFSFTVEPPAIVLTEPTDNTQVQRTYAAYDTPVDQAEPKTLNAKANVTFPDGHVRNIVEYEWISDGQPVGVTKTPEYTWDIHSFTQTHTLRARVRDELDTIGESPLITINVVSNIPEAPLSARVTDWLKQYGFVPALAFAVLALGFALFVWIRRPRMIMEPITTATMTIARGAQQVTEIFRPDQLRAARSARTGNAYLVVMEGDIKDRRIELTSQHTKLGREPSLVDVVFPDRSVSRLHARISEEHEGEYMLYDEGSSSGTYVNFKQVQYDPVALKEGNVINLGRVQLKFHLRDGSERTVPDDDMATEAFEGINPKDLDKSDPPNSKTTG